MECERFHVKIGTCWLIIHSARKQVDRRLGVGGAQGWEEERRGPRKLWGATGMLITSIVETRP